MSNAVLCAARVRGVGRRARPRVQNARRNGSAPPPPAPPFTPYMLRVAAVRSQKGARKACARAPPARAQVKMYGGARSAHPPERHVAARRAYETRRRQELVENDRELRRIETPCHNENRMRRRHRISRTLKSLRIASAAEISRGSREKEKY